MKKPSLEIVERCLAEAGISYFLERDDSILLGFSSKNYRDSDADRVISMRIWIESPCADFHSVVLEVRHLYSVLGLFSGRVLRILCERAKENGLSYSYSMETGEVRARVIVPLMSRQICTSSFAALVHGFAHAIDLADPLVRTLVDEFEEEQEEFEREILEMKTEPIHRGPTDEAVG